MANLVPLAAIADGFSSASVFIARKTAIGILGVVCGVFGGCEGRA
jgi:hypothetical protein